MGFLALDWPWVGEFVILRSIYFLESDCRKIPYLGGKFLLRFNL